MSEITHLDWRATKRGLSLSVTALLSADISKSAAIPLALYFTTSTRRSWSVKGALVARQAPN